jgi:hypothetical protein
MATPVPRIRVNTNRDRSVRRECMPERPALKAKTAASFPAESPAEFAIGTE